MPHVPASTPRPRSPREESRPQRMSWAMGVTLVEALTQRVPVLGYGKGWQSGIAGDAARAVRKIVRNCLVRDAARRWTPAEISAHLVTGGSRDTEDKRTQQAVPGVVKERFGATPLSWFHSRWPLWS